MTLLITGSTAAYSENWGRVFRKKKRSSRKKAGAKNAKKAARKTKAARR
jgi:hypothetical protein